MTQVVRLLGRFRNGGAGSLDVVCGTASAISPNAIGSGGAASPYDRPSLIVLRDVRADSLDALQKRLWSHIVWAAPHDGQVRDFTIQKMIVSAHDVRVLV